MGEQSSTSPDPRPDNTPKTDDSSSLTRRQFLGTGAAAGGALILGGAEACGPSDGGREGADSSVAGGGVEPGRPWPVSSFELEEVSITDLHSGMVSGRWTSQEVTQMYLDRIAEIDDRGPTLRAIIETNPDALEIAATLDREREGGEVRGCLHGIPILLKDNIATHDRLTTTAGSYALEGSIPPEDSWLAWKLRSPAQTRCMRWASSASKWRQAVSRGSSQP